MVSIYPEGTACVKTQGSKKAQGFEDLKEIYDVQPTEYKVDRGLGDKFGDAQAFVSHI